MGLVHLWLAAYGRAGAVLAMAALSGYPISRRIVRGPAGPPLAILVGLAAFGTAVCLLAWVRLLYLSGIIVIALLAAGASAWCLRSDVPRWREELARVRRPRATVAVCFAVLTAALLAFSVLALYPPKDDAALYHLPLARDLVAQHGLVYDPFVRYSFFPQANELMYAVMSLIGAGEVGPAALEFSVLAVGALTLQLWFIGSGRWAGGGLVAALALLASPVVVFAGTSAFVDTWTMVFVLGGLLLALDAAEARTAALGTLALAGLLLGEAAATKYSGALFGAIAIVAAVVAAGRSRAFWRAMPALLAAGAAVALPWYAWTFDSTGDPLYPFATSLFGNRAGLWSAREIHHQYLAARAAAPGIGSVLHKDLEYLLGESSYNTGAHRSPLSWWLASGFLGLLDRSSWRDRTFLGVALATALSVAISFVLSADPRYLLPALGVPALLVGLAVDRALWALYPRLAAMPRLFRAAPIAYVAALVVLLWSPASYALQRTSAGGPPTTATRIDAFLASNVACYPAVAYLNIHAGTGYRAWGTGCEKATYYAKGRLIGDAFSIGSWYRILNSGAGGAVSLPDPQTLRQRLAPLKVGWLIVPVTLVRDPAALQAGGIFRLATTQDKMDVYRISVA